MWYANETADPNVAGASLSCQGQETLPTDVSATKCMILASLCLLNSNNYLLVVYICKNYQQLVCTKKQQQKPSCINISLQKSSSRNKATYTEYSVDFVLNWEFISLSDGIINFSLFFFFSWSFPWIIYELKQKLWVEISNLFPVAFRDVSSQFSGGRVFQCTSRLGNELLCCLAGRIKIKLKTLICGTIQTLSWENEAIICIAAPLFDTTQRNSEQKCRNFA